MESKSRILIIFETTALICLAIVLGLYVSGLARPAEPEEPSVPESLEHDGYTLEQVVVLSRHNIRSPLVGGDSVLSTVTPHEWFEWTSPASQLSVRGGTLEASMGQYFRKWMEAEELFPENYQPKKEEVRIYANSKQRTIATAQFFTAGLLPAANEEVEHHGEFDTMDPVFAPCLTYMSDGYVKAAQEQINTLYYKEIGALADNYELVSDVIDMEESSGAKDGSIKPFRTDDTTVILEKGKEPAMEGSLKTACTVSDAMTLQYYEEADGRRFTFLCGHDSNLESVLAALEADKYDLPETIEKKTPIGSKLVFTKWRSADGGLFWDVDMVYQTTEQLRDADILTEENHPASVDLSFRGISQNSDSLYTDADIRGRLNESIEKYSELANY